MLIALIFNSLKQWRIQFWVWFSHTDASWPSKSCALLSKLSKVWSVILFYLKAGSFSSDVQKLCRTLDMAKSIMMERKYANNAEDKIIELSETKKLQKVSSTTVYRFWCPSSTFSVLENIKLPCKINFLTSKKVILPIDKKCRVNLWSVWYYRRELLGSSYLWEHSVWGVIASIIIISLL